MDTYHLCRNSIDASLKAKNVEQAYIYISQLHTYSKESSSPHLQTEVNHYLASISHTYNELVKKEASKHVNLTRKSLQTISEWLESGNGLAEFEDEFFNEESLNKVVLEYFTEADDEETKESELDTDEEQKEEENKPRTMNPRRVAREWDKIEHEAEFLFKPMFSTNDEAKSFRMAVDAMRPAVRARLELEDIRRMIKVRGAGRRFARIRAALIRGDAVIVLRHYKTLDEDATQLRAQHPHHSAADLFATRAEGLVRMVEQKRPALEAQVEAEKERRLSAIKEVMREVGETKGREGKVEKEWKDAKERADAINQKHKELTNKEKE